MSGHFTWRKLSAAKWEDVWWDRLSEVADRLAITALAGAKTIRLEAFQLSKTQAEKLRRAFGGQVAEQKKTKTLPAPAPRAPIRVRGKIVVVATEREAALAFDTTGFTSNTGGTFSVLAQGNNLVLEYTTPEPGSGVLLALSAGLLAARRWRR
jgi:hypothetical protein